MNANFKIEAFGNRLTRCLLIVVALCFCGRLQPNAVYASDAGVRFQAVSDRNRIELGGTLNLTVTVTLPGSDTPGRLVLPDPKGFETVSTMKGVQTSFSFGGGGRRSERSTTHTIVLRATEPGTLTIAPAIMEYKGKTYRTEPITVRVVASTKDSSRPQRSRTRSQRPPSLFDDDFDPFTMLDQLTKQLHGETRERDVISGRTPPAVGDSDIFVSLLVDKEEVWLGEQVTAEIVIFSRYDISGFPTPPVMPQMEGFWQEDIERPTQIRPQITEMEGRTYRAYLLRRMALFPTRSGEIVIDPVEVQVETGMGLFRSGRAIRRQSEPVVLQVRPLPVLGREAGFSASNVGEWDINAALSSNHAAFGDPLTLSVSISGFGNIHAVEAPVLQEIEGLRVYEPTTSQESRVHDSRFGGIKTVTWVMIPDQPGEYSIPGLTLHYFDPEAGRYESRSTESLEFAVTGDRLASRALGEASAAFGGMNLSDADTFRPIRYGLRPSMIGPPPYRSPVFHGIVLVPTLLIFGIYVVAGIRRALDSNDDSAKARRAPSVARARLKQAGKLLREGDKKGALVDVLSSLHGFLDALEGLNLRGLSCETLRNELSRKGYSGELIADLVSLLDRLESLRYSPIEPEASEVDELIQETAVFLKRLTRSRHSEPNRASNTVLSAFLFFFATLFVSPSFAHALPASSGSETEKEPLTVLSSDDPFLLTPPVSRDQAANLMSKGDDAYLDGKYEEALSYYRSVAQGGFAGADVWFNLGNAAFMAGLLWEAILAWERSLLHDPGHRDAAVNLRLARSELLGEHSLYFAAPVMERLGRRLPIRGVFWGFALCWFVMITALIIRKRVKRGSFGAMAGLAGILVVILGSLSLLSFWYHEVLVRAVVKQDATHVRLGPAPRFDPAFQLGEGTVVRVVGYDGPYARIEMGRDHGGWVLRKHIERI